jgi:hypothetical protein
MIEAKIADFETRLAVIEQSYSTLATEFKTFCEAHGVKHQTLADAFDAFKNEIGDKLDTITVFVSGANTIFGLARKHWRRVFIFGAGAMTSAGIGNPKFLAFLTSFAGG